MGRRFASALIFLIVIAGGSVLYADDSVRLMVGRSTVVNLGTPITRVSLTSPDVADALVTSPNELLINGKTPGTISMFVRDRAGAIPHEHRDRARRLAVDEQLVRRRHERVGDVGARQRDARDRRPEVDDGGPAHHEPDAVVGVEHRPAGDDDQEDERGSESTAHDYCSWRTISCARLS